MKYNELPVHTEWQFRGDAKELYDENLATYHELERVCMFGEASCGGKVVIKRMRPNGRSRRFHIINNPIRLDVAHIALFCDSGHLGFGYRSEGGGIIEIYGD